MTGTELAMVVGVCAVVGASYALISRSSSSMRVARRLNLATGGAGMTRAERRLARHSANVRSGFGKILSVLGSLLPLGDDDRNKIARSLRRAGYPSSSAVTAVLGAKTASILAGLVIGVAAIAPRLPGIVGIGLGILGGLLAGMVLNLVPELVVNRLAAARMRRITAGLADAFDLMIVCLGAGLTFERALHRTVTDLRSFQPDLAAEFRQASFDMSVHGRTREDALGRLAARLDSADFRDLATTVAQSERHGTPLADALRKFAGSFRVATIAGMQEKMARLPILLILPTLVFVVPGMLVIVGGPAFLQLMESLASFGE